MECVPTKSVVVVNFAWCVLVLMLAVPIAVVPFLKVTLPPVAPPNAPITVAVKVTAVPWVEGFSDDASLVVVAALLTVWLIAGDVLPRKLAFVGKTAVTEWTPAPSAVVEKTAFPALSIAEPITLAPFLKLTEPVAGPL